MYHHLDNLTKKTDRIVGPFVRVLHEKLGLNPNDVTFFSFLLSVAAAVFFFFKGWAFGFVFMFLSLFFDVIDGAMARNYGMVSRKVEIMETISDRASEFLIFFSFVMNGMAGIRLFALTYFAIVLNTPLRKKANIDLGFKRAPLVLIYFVSLNLIFTLIFFVNLSVFMLQLAVLDYRDDKKRFCKKR